MERFYEATFPKLATTGYKLTSPLTTDYNCIAWAAGSSDRWWWPRGAYWPPGVPRQATPEAFIQAYSTLGYSVCEAGELRDGYEKIVIYLDANGTPQHAARQLKDGSWTSKLGEGHDIMHSSVEGVENDIYGEATIFMERKYANG